MSADSYAGGNDAPSHSTPDGDVDAADESIPLLCQQLTALTKDIDNLHSASQRLYNKHHARRLSRIQPCDSLMPRPYINCTEC